MGLLYPLLFFFFNDTATTEIYTLSLHDALPISSPSPRRRSPSASALALRRLPSASARARARLPLASAWAILPRSEEHTSELQSHSDLVCRLLLEKKKNGAYVPDNQN